MTRTVLWEKQGRIAVIRFANPPINCVNELFLQDFDQVLDEIEKLEEIEVMVIASSNSKIFATGRDERSQIANSHKKQKLLKKIMERLANLPIPTICVITGTAIGAGLEIALVCDLRIASECSRFGFYSDIPLTEYGNKALIDLAGPAKAKELTWLGQLVGGREALGIGIINRLFPESHITNEALEMAFSIIQYKQKIESGK